MDRTSRKLSDIVCWTRVQAEAGQAIQSIVARKELERRAGDGLFMWGVGNPPSRSTRTLAARQEDIDVIFSLMLSRPNPKDVAPSGILVWQTYFDLHDVERPLPRHVLVTSRMEGGSGPKTVHFALMCHSHVELRLDEDGEPFDPTAYRNIGDGGGPVGHSQVTALIVRTGDSSPETRYRVNLRARLTGSYWVRLAKPCILGATAVSLLKAASTSTARFDADEWVSFVSNIRSIKPIAPNTHPRLF